MGSLLLAAGEKGHRYSLPNASVMIHRKRRYQPVALLTMLTMKLNQSSSSLIEPSGGASGQATDISIHAKEILRIRQVLTKMYAVHSAVNGETEEEAMARFGE